MSRHPSARAIAIERSTCSTDFGIWTAERSKFVFLVLKKVGIDRPSLNSILLYQPFHFGHIIQSSREIPQHVQGKRRRNASQRENLGRIGELFFQRGSRSRL